MGQSRRVGGTRWHNRYPGAECDVQSHLYSFSFEPKVDWPRSYAGRVVTQWPHTMAKFECLTAQSGPEAFIAALAD